MYLLLFETLHAHSKACLDGMYGFGVLPIARIFDKWQEHQGLWQLLPADVCNIISNLSTFKASIVIRRL
jgi:hypothetical protein